MPEKALCCTRLGAVALQKLLLMNNNQDHQHACIHGPIPASWVLQADNLCFAWPQGTVFQQLHLQLPAGATLLQGGEGSGKTTLLRLLAGSLPLQQGHLTLNGAVLASAPQAYRRQVFWQDPRAPDFQAPSAQAWWQGMAARHAGWSAAALAAHVQGLGLQPHLHKPLEQLSTGSRRKVLLAAALASGAALVLIDEPLAALDAPSVRYLCQALATAAQQARQAGRAWVVAHPEDLPDVPWAHTLVLPDPVGPG